MAVFARSEWHRSSGHLCKAEAGVRFPHSPYPGISVMAARRKTALADPLNRALPIVPPMDTHTRARARARACVSRTPCTVHIYAYIKTPNRL